MRLEFIQKKLFFSMKIFRTKIMKIKILSFIFPLIKLVMKPKSFFMRRISSARCLLTFPKNSMSADKIIM